MRRFLFAMVLASAAPAAADTPPWSVGVTDAQKSAAQGFLEAGNALFLERKYGEALERYRKAVEAWDHPAIRFNIVRCLIQLDCSVEAYDNLKLALKYGAAPLEDAVYTEALSYEKLLANEIADLTVECKQGGVKVTLDGQPLASCPAVESRRVTPGPHQVVGVKDGFLTQTLEVNAVGGKQQTVTVSLEPLAAAARIEHRWQTWVPWTVFASGFVIAGFGGLLDVNAYQLRDQYDAAIGRACPVEACNPDMVLSNDDKKLKSRFERDTRIAVGMIAAGGAVVVTGAVMLYLNRGRTVYPESVEKVTPSVTPVPGGAALSLSGAF